MAEIVKLDGKPQLLVQKFGIRKGQRSCTGLYYRNDAGKLITLVRTGKTEKTKERTFDGWMPVSYIAIYDGKKWDWVRHGRILTSLGPIPDLKGHAIGDTIPNKSYTVNKGVVMLRPKS